MAYLPAEKVGISVVVTYLPPAFDCNGFYPNSSDLAFRRIAAYLAPNDSPPMTKPYRKAC